MPVVKTITYENLEKEHKENPKIIPFPYKKPFPQEIEEYEKEKGAKKKDGIMGVASARGDREYLIMALSRYYTPRDLYYKTIKELDQMLQMHITESGGLI